MPTRLTVSLWLLCQPLVARLAAARSRGETPPGGPPRHRKVPLLAMLHLAFWQKVHSFGVMYMRITRRCALAPWEAVPLIPSEGQWPTISPWPPAPPRQGRAVRGHMLPCLAANLESVGRVRRSLPLVSPPYMLWYFSLAATTGAVLYTLLVGLHSKCQLQFIF